MSIALINLCKPTYSLEDPNVVNLTLAITFDRNINPEDYYILLTHETSGQSIELSGEIVDYDEANPKYKKKHPSQRHWHVTFDEIECGERYTYQIKHINNQPIYLLPNYLEAKAGISEKPHMPISFKAPPSKSTKFGKVRLMFGGDTEALNFLPLGIDKFFAKLLGLNFDQRVISSSNYSIIERGEYDLALHLGDYINGEKIKGFQYKGIEKIDEARKALESDHHAIVRGALGGIVSARLSEDHDGIGNGYDADTVNEKPMAFQNLCAASHECWPVPSNPESPNFGLYYQLDYGPISIWCLHTRAFHHPGQTLLGEEQTKWFKSSLAQSEASIKIVATPVPFAMGKNPNEDFRQNADEHYDILKTCAMHDVDMIVSADTHAYGMMKFVIHLEDGSTAEIPHYMVGTLGGKPQQMTKAELKLMPNPLLPEKHAELFQGSKVYAYYCASLMSKRWPKSKNQAMLYNESEDEIKWLGKEVQLNAYGHLEVEIDYEEASILSMFKAICKKDSKQRPFFEHQTSISYHPKTP